MGSGGEGSSLDDGCPAYLVNDPYPAKPCTMAAPSSPLQLSLTGARDRRGGYLDDALKAGGRCVKSVGTVATVSGKLRAGWTNRDRLLEDGVEDAELHDAWQRTFEDDLLTPLSDLACASGALFLKLGQLSAQQLTMAPLETRRIIERCRDRALSRPIDEMTDVLEASFGKPLEEVFACVERDAMGAASIAQVHRALLQSGEEVIVKIQHAKIATKMRADMCIMPLLTTVLSLGAPELVESMRSVLIVCRAMCKQELDMRIEGYNRERLAAIFERSKFASRSRHANLVFPRVFWEYTTERCMVQELVCGAVTMNDPRAVVYVASPYLKP